MNELEETKTTKQVDKMNMNPTGKGGFGDNPQNRSSGYWSAKDSISFQYKKFMKMSIDEVEKWAKNVKKKDRTVAQDLAYKAVLRAKKSLVDLKEVTDRTEGKAPQTLVHEGGFFSKNKLVIEIVDPKDATQPETETSA